MAKPGRKTKQTEPDRTRKANATPRLGQKMSSPYKRHQKNMARMSEDPFSSSSYNVGRTRRMA